jgi:hypothetical protein
VSSIDGCGRGPPALFAEQRSGLADAMHAGEEQLLVGDALQERLKNGDVVFRVEAGLLPTQPAVALLHRNNPTARGAVTRIVQPSECVAGAARPTG